MFVVESDFSLMPSLLRQTEQDKKNTSHSLLPFLQSQSQNTLTRLYQRPSSCLSIFRSFHSWAYSSALSDPCISLLAPLERQIVMNLLWLESAIATSTMVAWIQHDGRKWLWTSHFSRLERWAYYRLYEDALANLSRLHILLNSTVKLALNFTFKTSMRQALTGG